MRRASICELRGRVYWFIQRSRNSAGTLTGSNYQGGNQAIMNTPAAPGAPSLDGFNTTTGGSKYAEEAGGSLTFTFANPTQSSARILPDSRATSTKMSSRSMTINGIDQRSRSRYELFDWDVRLRWLHRRWQNHHKRHHQGGHRKHRSRFIGIDDVVHQGAPQGVGTTPERSRIALLGLGLLGAIGVMRKRFA